MEVKDTRSALPSVSAAASHGEAAAASPGGAGGVPSLLGPTTSTGDPSRPSQGPDDSAMGEGPSSAPESSGSRKRTIEQVNFPPFSIESFVFFYFLEF
jgi:hypothetical protein